MNTSLQSLIDCGTKLYLDSVDPELVKQNIEWGAVGATSNPVIISGLLGSGKFDAQLRQAAEKESNDEVIAWMLTDQVVKRLSKLSIRFGKRVAAMPDGSVSNWIR